MDLGKLIYFINGCNKHSDYIKRISLQNYKWRNKWQCNFDIEIHGNLQYFIDVDIMTGSKIINSVEHNEKVSEIRSDIFGSSFNNSIRVVMNDYMEAVFMMKYFYKNIKMYCNVKDVIAMYNGKNIETEYYDIVNELTNSEKHKILKQAGIENKELVLNNLTKEINKYLNSTKKVESIKNKIESNKNAYIVSKLVSGDLKRSDIKAEPELIKLADEIIKLDLLTGKIKQS